MGQILLLAIGSAWFPTILAAIAVILTRERPAMLLLALYVAGITTSIVCGLVILKLVGGDASKLGGSNDKTSPTFEFIAAFVAFYVAALVGTSRGRARIDRVRDRYEARRERRKAARGKDQQDTGKQSWTMRLLGDGSVVFAAVAGVILCLPGPFYLLALAEMVKANYSFGEEIIIVLIFNLIMFTFAEIPLVGYAVNPEGTAGMVGKMSAWLKANGLRVIAIFAFLWGILCLYKGFHDLAR